MGKGKRKTSRRPNPNRYKRPGDVDTIKLKKESVDEAVTIAWAIFFSVMRDKEGYGKIRLQRLWQRIGDLSDSIKKGYVKIDDLIETLYVESGLNLGYNNESEDKNK